MRRCRRRPTPVRLTDNFERGALALLEQAKLEQHPIRKRHPTGLAANDWRKIVGVSVSVGVGAWYKKRLAKLRRALEVRTSMATASCHHDANPNIVCPRPQRRQSQMGNIAYLRSMALGAAGAMVATKGASGQKRKLVLYVTKHRAARA